MVWDSGSYGIEGSSEGDPKTTIKDNVTLSAIPLNNPDIGSHPRKQSCDASVDKAAEPREDNAFKVPTRKVIIEPAMTMFYLFYMTSISLSNQYIYHAIGERHNLTAILDAERSEGNGTLGGGCGKLDLDKNSTGYRTQQQVQAETSRYNLYMSLVTDIPSFVLILFFGNIAYQYF